MPIDHPYAFWERVALMLSDAARLAGDQRAVWPVQSRAAQLCRVLAYQVAPSEGLCADVTLAAHACVKTFPIGHDLLMAALKLATDTNHPVIPCVRSVGSRIPPAITTP